MSRFLSADNMVFNPAVPEIATVTSESLQLKIRQLLPSQDGFGTDLAAQNVIVPIVDLTQVAEGSDVPEMLQTALAYGSQTAFDVTNTTTTIENTTGFFRVIGTWTCSNSSGGGGNVSFILTDGVTPKTVYKNQNQGGSADARYAGTFDFNVFLGVGESLQAQSSSTACFIQGSTRQIADINGTLVQPSGFTPQ